MEKFRYLDESHQYFLGACEMPGVTRILDGVGLISPFVKQNPGRTQEGKLAHHALALFGADNLDFATVDQRIMGWVLSGVKFYEALKFKPVVLESPSFHPDYLYGYTFDAIGKSTLGDVLLDFKTGKAGKTGRLQLAAYLDPVQKKWGGKWKRVAVELDEHGGEPNLVWYSVVDQRTDFADFLACRRVFDLLGWDNARENHKERA